MLLTEAVGDFSRTEKTPTGLLGVFSARRNVAKQASTYTFLALLRSLCKVTHMNPLQQIAFGFRFGFKGWSFFAKHRKLWAYALIPWLLNLTLMFAFLMALGHWFPELFATLKTHLLPEVTASNPAWYMSLWYGFLNVLLFFLKTFLSFLAFVILLLLFYLLSFILAAPFNDLLSEKVEQLKGINSDKPFHFREFLCELWRILKTETLKAFALLALAIVPLFLGFIPVLGPILLAPLTAILTSFDLGFNYADMPLARRLLPFAERMQFAKTNFWILVGFALPLLLPFAHFVLMPGFVVGGTLLTLTLKPSSQP